jgi:hypothetical protein
MDHLSFGICILKDDIFYGYGESRIQDQVRVLSNVILSVVVMHGSQERDGKEMLSFLLETDGAIRRYMELDPTPLHPRAFNVGVISYCTVLLWL